jgi:ArsR family metal-binding transcriptional regulator
MQQRKPVMPVEDSGDTKEEETVEVNPCTEDGFVTLESRLKSSSGTESKEVHFDPAKMCQQLKKVKEFSKIRCSKEIGYAIIEYGDKRIHVFKEGKIVIRHADNEQDAMKTLQMIKKALSGSMLKKSIKR